MEGVVGLDIGGSGVRGARVSAGGAPGHVARASLGDRRVKTVVDAAERLVAEVGGASRVGLGVPGFLRDGVVLASPNFPEWREVPIGALLTEALGVPVHVENDANAATWGAWVERGRAGDLVLLTLGTGVGGGVVSGGALLRGSGGTGAEVGHIWAGGDHPCGCGGRGCLETWASTVGLVREAAASGRSVHSGLEVVQAADMGEDWALALLHQAAGALGRGLVTLVNLFNPDRILLAGGLSRASHHLAPRAEAWLRDRAIGPSAERVTLEWIGPADTLAIRGAADLARSGESRQR